MRTLYAKLAGVLVALFCLIGGAFLVATLFSAHLYQQEVSQKLNRDLAAHVVAEDLLLKDGQINQDALKEIFHMLMVVNPSLELYLRRGGGTGLLGATRQGASRARVDGPDRAVAGRSIESAHLGRRSTERGQSEGVLGGAHRRGG